eukprot:4758641-Pyramimonas_sp.AAC.2
MKKISSSNRVGQLAGYNLRHTIKCSHLTITVTRTRSRSPSKVTHLSEASTSTRNLSKHSTAALCFDFPSTLAHASKVALGVGCSTYSSRRTYCFATGGSERSTAWDVHIDS